MLNLFYEENEFIKRMFTDIIDGKSLITPTLLYLKKGDIHEFCL